VANEPVLDKVDRLQRSSRDVTTLPAVMSKWLSTVLPAGAKPRSVTLDGQKVHYKLVSTPRGTAVEVAVKAPAAQETLAVRTAG